ncbi:Ig-like domain-containing protein [Yersinia sp. 1252 StPb PI]|uniref:Ig-like domain-containing protein n=1 Tax=Yersinia sp. 1252 StPb PI TaxID=3117404 RepID=UPI003B28D032
MLHRHFIFNELLIRLLLILMVIMSQAVQAVQQSTAPVHGRAPTTILSVNNTKPRVGDVITVTSAFNDADSDTEFGTTYQWILDGNLISGATSQNYTLSLSDIIVGSELNVVVTPQTDPSITEPSVGLPVQLPSTINIKWQRAISSLIWAESPLGAVADGLAVNTVRATVEYLDGTPAVNAVVHFSANNLGVVTPNEPTGTDGITTAFVTNFISGSTKVTASIDEDVQSIDTLFIAGPAELINAEVTQNNAVANGSDDNRILVRVNDRHHNDVVGETVNFTATNGVNLLYTSGETDSNGEVEIFLTSNTAARSEVTVTTRSGLSATATVEFFNEKQMTHILVNGTSFSVNDGFPKTGFTGAVFQLVIGESTAENTEYNWHADQGWVSVDAVGSVRFNQEPTSGNNTVTITAEHKTNGSLLTYRFTVGRWFRNNSFNLMRYSDAQTWCSSLVGDYTIPNYSQMTDRVPMMPTGSSRDANGRLWNEWGTMGSYSNGWFSGNYWVRELTNDSNERHYVYLGNGNLFSFPLDGTTYITCSASL